MDAFIVRRKRSVTPNVHAGIQVPHTVTDDVGEAGQKSNSVQNKFKHTGGRKRRRLVDLSGGSMSPVKTANPQPSMMEPATTPQQAKPTSNFLRRIANGTRNPTHNRKAKQTRTLKDLNPAPRGDDVSRSNKTETTKVKAEHQNVRVAGDDKIPAAKMYHQLSLRSCLCSVASYSVPSTKVVTSLYIARRNPPPSCKSNSDTEKGPIVLVRCTSTQQKMEYKLERNILRVFAQFRHQGKATIRLKVPELDVMISKARPMELNAFLDALHAVHTCPDVVKGLPGVGMLMMAQQSKAKISEDLQEKMTIDADREIPSKFPPNLVALKIIRKDLLDVPKQCFSLHLTNLDLSFNRLQSIPHEITAIKTLVALNLSNNSLSEFSNNLCNSRIRRLDLSHNKIKYCPTSIAKLVRVESLNLSDNQIEAVPSHIGRLKMIRDFKIARNKLKTLPADIRDLKTKLQKLDISGNVFQSLDNASAVLDFKSKVPTLEEISARAYILSHDKPEETKLTGLPLNVKCLLMRAGRCARCGGPFLGYFMRGVCEFDASSLSETLVRFEGGPVIPLIHQVCSRECQRQTQFLHS